MTRCGSNTRLPALAKAKTNGTGDVLSYCCCCCCCVERLAFSPPLIASRANKESASAVSIGWTAWHIRPSVRSKPNSIQNANDGKPNNASIRRQQSRRACFLRCANDDPDVRSSSEQTRKQSHGTRLLLLLLLLLIRKVLASSSTWREEAERVLIGVAHRHGRMSTE